MSKEKTNRINIFKIRKEYSINNFGSIPEYELIDHENKNIKLFIQKDKSSIPPWYRFLSDIYDDKIENKTNSFILFYQYKSSLYAIAGGYGHIRLDEYIDASFGLDLALRLIDEKSISYINQSSISGNTRQIQRSVVSYNPKFDKDNFSRILNSISGKGYFENKSFSVVGKKSITLRTEYDISNLDRVFKEIEETLNRKPKVSLFSSYGEVKKKRLIIALEKRMAKEIFDIIKNKTDKCDPYIDLPYYEYNHCSSLHLKYGVKKIGDLTDITFVSIKSVINNESLEIDSISDLHKIKIVGQVDNEDDVSYSLFQLISFETKTKNNEYIKIGNLWYRQLNNFVDYVDKYITTIEIEDDNYLPRWNTSNIKNKIEKSQESDKSKYAEQIYNEESEIFNKDFILMDRKTIKIQGYSKIEACDIYDSKRHNLIHVKKTWGASSSYLFSQAYISAEMYIHNLDFRNEFKNIAKMDSLPESLPSITIAIAIDEKNKGKFPLNLSSFAKLALYNIAHEIRGLGYKISLAPIIIE